MTGADSRPEVPLASRQARTGHGRDADRGVTRRQILSIIATIIGFRFCTGAARHGMGGTITRHRGIRPTERMRHDLCHDAFPIRTDRALTRDFPQDRDDPETVMTPRS